jgi:hypothetical protein
LTRALVAPSHTRSFSSDIVDLSGLRGGRQVWTLEDWDGLIPQFLEAHPHLKPEFSAWLEQWQSDPWSAPKTWATDGAIGMRRGWWYPVRGYAAEIVLDEAEFGVLTGIKPIPEVLSDAITGEEA